VLNPKSWRTIDIISFISGIVSKLVFFTRKRINRICHIKNNLYFAVQDSAKYKTKGKSEQLTVTQNTQKI